MSLESKASRCSRWVKRQLCMGIPLVPVATQGEDRAEVVDVCGGHGALAMLCVAQGAAEGAVIIDQSAPPSHRHLRALGRFFGGTRHGISWDVVFVLVLGGLLIYDILVTFRRRLVQVSLYLRHTQCVSQSVKLTAIEFDWRPLTQD